jgi:hypothetical protein
MNSLNCAESHGYKAKQSHNTPMEARGRERMYRSYSFTTSTLDGDEWSESRPGCSLPPEKGPLVPIGQQGWAPEPVWTQRLQEESSFFCRRLNLDRLVVHSVVRHYSDWLLSEYKSEIYRRGNLPGFSLRSICVSLSRPYCSLCHGTNTAQVRKQTVMRWRPMLRRRWKRTTTSLHSLT